MCVCVCDKIIHDCPICITIYLIFQYTNVQIKMNFNLRYAPKYFILFTFNFLSLNNTNNNNHTSLEEVNQL